jgi:hypothetical protein
MAWLIFVSPWTGWIAFSKFERQTRRTANIFFESGQKRTIPDSVAQTSLT